MTGERCNTFGPSGQCPKEGVGYALAMGVPVPLCEQHEWRTDELHNAYAVHVAEMCVSLAYLTGRVQP
jgi:hypothetical protein